MGVRKAISNMDPAARMEDKLTLLIPDFDTNDLNTLLPWLYGDGSDEQQPNPELVKAMCVGQPQTFTKMPEGAEDMPARPSVAQYAAAVANREALLKPEVDPRINPMDANSLFQVKDWGDDSDEDSDDDNYQEGPVHKLPRGRGRRRRYIQTENGWECVECGLAMSKREYMRGHYEECMGGGRVLPNVPKDLVIVGSEKGGMKRPLEGEEVIEGGIKKPKVEDEDILKCFGCKHVYRTLTEIRAHLAAYEKCSTSTWVCDDCPKTFGAERSLRIHTLQVHQTELICDKCAKTSVPITKSSSAIYKEPISPRKRKKTACTNAQSVRDLSITKRIWNVTWENTKRELSKKATINRKKSSFAISVEKSMETTNLGSITSRVTALSTNAKLVLVASKRLVVSNTTWHCILVLLHSTVESVGKLLLLGTNLFFIKNH